MKFTLAIEADNPAELVKILAKLARKHPTSSSSSPSSSSSATSEPSTYAPTPAPLELIDKGWLVRGPYQYGSHSRGQKMGLRIQHPSRGQIHHLFMLSDAEMQTLVELAKKRGQYRARLFSKPADEEAPAPEPTVAPNPSTSTSKDDASEALRKDIVCLDCKKVIGQYPQNRHGPKLKADAIKTHLKDTGHQNYS